MHRAGTIKKYLRIWNTLGISYEEFCSKSDEELARLFSVNSLTAPPNSRLEALEEKLPEYCKKLGKRGMPTLQVHREYLRSHPDGISSPCWNASLRSTPSRRSPPK